MKSFCLTLSAFFVALGTPYGGSFLYPRRRQQMLSHAEPYQLPGWCPDRSQESRYCGLSHCPLRNLLGTGSFWLFQEASSGRTLQECSLPAQKKRELPSGEMIGTGLVAALIASFMSTYLMGKTVPFYFLSFPFGMSALGGALLAGLIMKSPLMTAVKKKIRKMSLGPRITTRTSGCRSFLLMKP